MRKGLGPAVLGLCVAAATFALALATVFEPERAASSGPVALGDAYTGELLFEERCAGCHGDGGSGGSGPRLAGSGIHAELVQTRIEQGAGVMPPGLVTGEDVGHVVAYVLEIAAE